MLHTSRVAVRIALLKAAFESKTSPSPEIDRDISDDAWVLSPEGSRPTPCMLRLHRGGRTGVAPDPGKISSRDRKRSCSLLVHGRSPGRRSSAGTENTAPGFSSAGSVCGAADCGCGAAGVCFRAVAKPPPPAGILRQVSAESREETVAT